MPPSLSLTPELTPSPGQSLQRWLQGRGEALALFEFSQQEAWERSSRRLWLVAYRAAGGHCQFSILPAERSAGVLAQAQRAALPGDALQALLGGDRAPLLSLGAPLRLQPVEVPKPWGREIWYTGIEPRGISGVGEEKGTVPLSWLLAALPEFYGPCPPVLLKILDPLPEEVIGDLYFELHEKKREVYVVTSIDHRAWPDGKGAIRYGFDPEVRADFVSDEEFRQAYLSAVQDYRAIRVAVDRRLDQWLSAQGLSSSQPLSPELRARAQATLPEALREQERTLRRAMERFTRLRSLQVGDVVQVPLHLPHALQHGVRTVEFQTPVYERLILSFAQKVLTQDHWDTEQAVAQMVLEPPAEEPLPIHRQGADWVEEQIVDFVDFEALRLQGREGAETELPQLAQGGVAMAVGAGLALAGQRLEAEQAMLLPIGEGLKLRLDEGAQLLWARPRGSAGRAS